MTLLTPQVSGLPAPLFGLKRIAALDGWRAVACLLVLFHHTGFTLRCGPLVVWGFTGVHLFFVLSGYLLYRPICKAIVTHSPFGFGDFYIRRLLRIYPPYLLSLIAFSAVRYATNLHPPSTHNLVTHLLLIHNTSIYREFFGINTVFWTLAMEMQFYLLLPIVAFSLKYFLRSKTTPTIYSTAGLFFCIGLVSRAYELSLTRGPSTLTTEVVRFHTVFSYLDLFASGMFISAFITVNAKTMNLDRVAGWSLFVGGMALFLFANAWCARATGYGDWMEVNQPYFLWGFPPVLCAGIALILFVVIRGNTPVTSFLASAPLAYIGRISYSVYLFHVFVQLGMFKLIPLNSVHSYYLRAFCWGLISLVPTLILATGVYYLVEAPFLRLAEHFKNRNAKFDSVTDATLVSTNPARVAP